MALACELGVNADTLRRLGAGWDAESGRYAFPERDGAGRVVGVGTRGQGGRKGFLRGGQRGLVVPRGLSDLPGPVIVVEGPSDVAASLTLGLAAVGRPSCNQGAAELAELLGGRDVLIVGERDQKPDGAWPGREGASYVATELARAWNRSVRWTLPPEGANDIREWLGARVVAGLDLGAAAACQAEGEELCGELEAATETVEPEAGGVGSGDAGEGEKRTSQALKLVRLFRECYRIGRTTEGDPFAVEHGGPNIARMLRGGGDSLRAELARAYFEREDRVAGQTALASALLLLEGEAQRTEAESVHLRVARHREGIVLDLGDEKGRVAVVDAKGWRLREQSPVLFRRTALTCALPKPAENGRLDRLWKLANMAERDQPLVLAWLCTALMPDLECPIVLLGGQAGVGKSTAAETLAELIDPSSAPLRSAPRDVENWAVQAAGSRVVALDNLSRIDGWLSDALCRAVTGDGMVRRARYTDSGLSVLAYSRAVVLTSIDPGALRGDLGERLVLFELEPIPANRRRPRAELRKLFLAVRPALLGALLDLLARVQGRLPTIHLPEMGRMADFERVLAAVDAELRTRGLATYREQGMRIAEDVVEGDSVGEAVRDLAERSGEKGWVGTATELLKALRHDPPPKGWPTNGRAMSGRLRHLRASLLAVGVEVVPPGRGDRPRLFRVRRVLLGDGKGPTVGTVGPSQSAPLDVLESDSTPTVGATVGRNRRGDRRGPSAPGGPGKGGHRRSDGPDGRTRPLVGQEPEEDPHAVASVTGQDRTPAKGGTSAAENPSPPLAAETPPAPTRVPDAPPDRCYTCRGSGSWRRLTSGTGGWVCETCHPPTTATEALGPWERLPGNEEGHAGWDAPERREVAAGGPEPEVPLGER